MEINLNKLNEKQLLNLKDNIEVKLCDIEKSKILGKKFKSQNTECLGYLEKGDLIFCIIFNGEKIWNVDYVNIYFNKKEDSGSYTNFTSSHDTKPMGCSSALLDEDLHGHYFLSDFSSSFKFFTLKPNTWKKDLTTAMENYERRRKEYYVDRKVNNIKSFIDTFDISSYL